ncbi:MAG: RtcB family protein [Deltaproteobacteria bacterium]
MPIPKDIVRISETEWEIPVACKPGMRVPARIYATESLLEGFDDGVFDQVKNVATLPGIVGHACCMPDGHWGYGFPIGGLAAMDPGEGVISPGGIGFDINCGMRLCLTNLTFDEVKPRLRELVDRLAGRIPAGVGAEGTVRISRDEFREVSERGARWAVKRGFGWKEDLDRTEEGGCIEGADASRVSEKAVDRGYRQIGTLGSGNHYLEIQVARAENVIDREIAASFGIVLPDQVVVMFHCGSRGFGHQVATDHLRIFVGAMRSKYGIQVPDRELACAPFRSPEGQDYFAAMKCAVNMSFANRQVILHRIREVFSEVFGRDPKDLGMRQVYDVAHNTAKLERHILEGKARELLVHRKGATRAFGPGMAGIPDDFRDTGQPVILGGSMETGSYLLAGVPTAGRTFFTTAHGSGRAMSRTSARKRYRGRQIQERMEDRGIYVRTASWSGLAEEAGAAYKDIDQVVEATERAGLSRRVVKLLPVGNVKG